MSSFSRELWFVCGCWAFPVFCSWLVWAYPLVYTFSTFSFKIFRPEFTVTWSANSVLWRVVEYVLSVLKFRQRGCIRVSRLCEMFRSRFSYVRLFGRRSKFWSSFRSDWAVVLHFCEHLVALRVYSWNNKRCALLSIRNFSKGCRTVNWLRICDPVFIDRSCVGWNV